jgi:hypothetical protein
MTLRIPICRTLSLSLLFLTLPVVHGQTADDFFHGGALSYLSNNIPVALETVTNGLQRFPDNDRLKKLYDLLKQQQQQNQQNQKDQKQDQSNDQKQDQQKQNDKQKNEEQEKKEAQDKQNQARKDQQQTKPGDKSKDKPEEKSGDPQQIAAHAMTPQEAKQLLDAQKGDEQVLQFVPQGEPKNQSKPLKDW